MTEIAVQTSANAESVDRGSSPKAARWRLQSITRALRRMEWYLDASEGSRSKGAGRLRWTIGSLFLVYAVVLETTSIRHGDFSVMPVLIAVGATPMLLNRFGRFVYYFLPVFLGLISYMVAAQFAMKFKLGVHYTPQLKMEEWLFPGSIPTVWLQDHLYKGTTGPLEDFAVAMYASHFVIPLVLALTLALTARGRAFTTLMFAILAVSILGEMTFILAPTAPPWLAAQHGYVSSVHHVLKQSLFDLHMTKLAQLSGDPTKYDITAAVPSLHVAFPVLCLLTARRFRMHPLVSIGLALNTIGVVFSIVYMGEHYLFDAVVGVLYALVAWFSVRWLLGRDDDVADRADSAAK